MRIVIIGAGFSGLSAAYYALKDGHQVTVIEKNPFLGGLAAGFNEVVSDPPPWEWELEQFYHHWFTNDSYVFDLATELGVRDKMMIKRPVSATLAHQTISPLDSPLALLKYPHLSWSAKIKTAITLAKLKYLYNEKSSIALENITAHDYLQKHMGQESYQLLWEPLLKGKFDHYYQEINMRWFWARIYKRTPNLAYYQGGFASFACDIATKIREMNATIELQATVEKIEQTEKIHTISYVKNEEIRSVVADAVIVTTPPATLPLFYPNLPEEYKQKLKGQDGIGALVLVLALHHPLMKGTYWLNINEKDWPFLAVVEHTNFMDKSHYNNEHLVYIGDYLPADHPHMQWTEESMIEEITPYLKKINPLFGPESIIRSYLFKARYAQPLVRVGHEKNILPIKTPIDGVYLATMAQVYPWDRGTNYAIEIGKKAVEAISRDY